MGEFAIPLAIAAASAVGTAVVAQATKPDMPDIPAPDDPGKIPTADDAIKRRLLQRQRADRASLRIDPTPSGTGLQIP